MPASSSQVSFNAVLARASGSYNWTYFLVPAAIVKSLGFTGNTRRVECLLNDKRKFQCAVLPNGKGEWFITVNKDIRTFLGIDEGSKLKVKLKKDTSKYGLPMPAEFREVLKQDDEGNKLFHALTAGRQRTLIYQVISAKGVDKKIRIALIILEHLKENDAAVDYKKLGFEMRRPIE
jgi:hypothetical protein